MSASQAQPARSPGFTLTELVVVMGILAVLAAIVLPVIGTVRAAANSAQCKSNLHQLMSAFLAYVPDNQGLMPANSYNVNSNQDIVYWFGWTPNSFPEINRVLDPSRGMITKYLGSAAANGLQCPCFPYDDPTFVPKFSQHAADYGLNIYLCPYSYQNTAYHLTQVQYPATTVIFADVVQMDSFPTGSFNEAFYLGIDNNGASLAPFGGFVHWRHPGQTANVAYLDGHVDQVSEKTGYIVTTVSDNDAGHLTSGDISATSPYGSVP
jgi:prepilin-type N-terminal cleavage/methylation domain-containing protein/prepilin-type processing-associated H-X9-DG protein